MAAKKRTTKKKITETQQWQVTMSRVKDARVDQIVKIVDAPSQQDALRQAINSVPDGHSYTSVIAQPASPSPGQPSPIGPQTRPVTQTAAQIPERFNAARLYYPYLIVLPKGFEGLLRESAPKGINVADRYGRLHVQIPNAKILERFMKGMAKSKHPVLSQTLIDGIAASMR